MDMHRYTQDHRLISISDFSLGKDTFLLTGFDGSEYISELFQFSITVLSTNVDILPEMVIGKSVDITIQNEHQRSFHGYISEFVYGEVKGDGLREYRMIMVPWLWFLSQTNNHRIFQNKNTKSIVTQVFSDLGYTDFDFQAQGGQVREYCIQHNESDLHFISRLLEEDGIAYFFKHELGKHSLVLVDDKGAYDACVESDVGYSKGSSPDQQIFQWEHLYKFKKGRWTAKDYNFKQPANTVMGSTPSTSRFDNNKNFEHYHYPAFYDTQLGDDLVKIRLDSEELDRNSVKGKSNCSTFYAGGRFSVCEHTTKAEKGGYVLASVHHRAHDNSYLVDKESGSGYENTFVCVPDATHIRPSLKHNRPVMRGPQTAVVVGPAGEEIYTDEFGRIKVQFIWDREGNNDEHSTCFIRVMQTWAGNKWGASFIPRIGHEVVVEFMDGDPDRPIVSGSVYNGKNGPPYESKTQSGIKSRSTKGGSASNFNEIRFDDKLGAEQLYFQAEKNQDNLVKNNETTSVGNNRTETVGANENITVGSNRTESVGADENITIGANRTESVGANENITVGSNRTENVGASESINIGSSQTISVGSSRTENVGSSETVSVAKMRTHSVGVNDMLNVGAAQEVSVGGFRMVNVGLFQNRNTGLNLIEKVGKAITIDAGDEITIKTGDSSLHMKSDGTITLTGKDISFVASGEMTAKCTENMVLKAKKILEN